MASKSLTFDIFGRDRTASKALQGVGHSATGLTKIFAAVGGAIAAAFAVTRIVNFARATVTEFAEAEAAQGKLSDAFERFPALVGGNVEALRALNTELQKKTRFDDDALAAGQAQLAQYGLTQQQLEKITPLLADYAAKTGKDVTTAAEDLGKALLGSGRALKLIGVDFVDTGSVAGNFEEIMAALSAQVGGFAEKDAKTLIGQLAVLKNAFGEVKESVGSLFAPAVGLLASTINEKLLPVLAILVEKYGPSIEAFFTAVADKAGKFLDGLAQSLQNGDFKNSLPKIAVSFAALGDVLMQDGVIDALKQLATDVLPPLVDLLVAVAPAIPPIASALSTVLVPALQLAATYLNGLSALWSGDVRQQANWIRSTASIPGVVGDAFRAYAVGVVAAVNIVVDGFNTLAQAYRNLVAVFGVKISVPTLPRVSAALIVGSGKTLGKHADGALFESRPGGHVGIFGEGRDDEVALPLNRDVYARVGAGIAAAGGGGGGTSIVIQMGPGSVISNQREAIQWMARAYDQVRRQGGIPSTAFSG